MSAYLPSPFKHITLPPSPSLPLFALFIPPPPFHLSIYATCFYLCIINSKHKCEYQYLARHVNIFSIIPPRSSPAHHSPPPLIIHIGGCALYTFYLILVPSKEESFFILYFTLNLMGLASDQNNRAFTCPKSIKTFDISN